MKKIALLHIIAITLAFAKANAGMTDWEYFEPTLGCAAGATGMYMSSKKGTETNNALIGCLVGGAIGYWLNDHYKSKYTTQREGELKDMKKIIDAMERANAERTIKGEPNRPFLIQEEVVPAQKLENGEVIDTTIKYKIVVPDLAPRLGK